MAKAKIDWKRIWDRYIKWCIKRPPCETGWNEKQKKIEQLVEAELKAKVKRG